MVVGTRETVTLLLAALERELKPNLIFTLLFCLPPWIRRSPFAQRKPLILEINTGEEGSEWTENDAATELTT